MVAGTVLDCRFPLDLLRIEMADQPKRTGVYETPGTTPDPVTDSSSPAAASGSAAAGAMRSAANGRTSALPSWVWIVAAVVALAVLGAVFL